MIRSLAPALAVLLGLVAAGAFAESVDWDAHKGVGTVVIVTTDADGTARDTTIWLCVVDGQGYVRGGSGHWVANSLRDGDVKLRVSERELSLRAEKLTDAAAIERVTAAYREKYGFSDVLATIVRGEPTIFRLTPR
jgi:hypothetical protein